MAAARASIIIPTKDRPALVARAVRSALAACPSGGEVIVVDDGSDPPMSATLLGVEDPRLKLVVNGQPHGASPARNTGIGQSSGDVIFFLDDDDEMLPDYPAVILDRLRGAQALDYGFGGIEIVDTRGSRERRSEKMRLGESQVLTPDLPFRQRMFPFSVGFWITRDAFNRAGPLDAELTTNGDTEYACRVAAAGLKGWFEARPATRIHRHDDRRALGQITSRTPAAVRAACFRTILARYSDYLETDRSALAYLARRFVKLSVKAGQIEEARAFCRTLPGPLAGQMRAHAEADRMLYAASGLMAPREVGRA